MKKLFNIGSLIVIEEFSSLRITGPYELVTLGPDFVVIKSANYVLEVSGEELIVEKLAEEVAVFSFDLITELKMSQACGEEAPYGS